MPLTGSAALSSSKLCTVSEPSIFMETD
jgi:hypothetical protein